jgi:hypothetical protein
MCVGTWYGSCPWPPCCCWEYCSFPARVTKIKCPHRLTGPQMAGGAAHRKSRAYTLVLEYDNIANNDHVMLHMLFEGNRVVVEGRETAHEVGVRFEGTLDQPE